MSSLAGPRPGQRPAEVTLYDRRVAELTAAVFGPRPASPPQAGEPASAATPPSDDPRWKEIEADATRLLVARPSPVHNEGKQLALGDLGTVGPQELRAITVLQPYAWLLAHAGTWPVAAGKTSEVRTQSTSYRGTVLVHVSKRWTGAVDRTVAGLRRQRMIGGPWPEPTKAELVGQLGKAIAVAELVGCRVVTAEDDDPWVRLSVRAVLEGLAAKPPRSGKPTTCWAWQLDDVRLIEPIALEGKLGLWHAPKGLEIRERGASAG